MKAKPDCENVEVDALKRLQAETAAELAALRNPRMEIDTSPLILSPFEAERKNVASLCLAGSP